MRHFLKWLGLIKDPPCDHERYDFGSGPIAIRTIEGVTLDYGLYPAPIFRWTSPCKKCGKTFFTEGLLRDWKDHVSSDDTGWPIDEQGVRYPAHFVTQVN